jgi:hypothetical protein
MARSIMRLLPTTAVAGSAGMAPWSAVIDDQPKVAATAVTAGPNSVDIDFGSVQAWDSLFVGFHNASPTATLAASYGSGGYTEASWVSGAPMRLAGAPGPRYDTLLEGFAVNSRYVRITFSHGVSGFFVGAVGVGQRFTPTVPQDWESKTGFRDTGARTKLDAGGVAIRRGERVRTLTWTWGRLTDAELDKLDAMVGELGETSPLVTWAELSDPGAWRRLAFGYLDQMTPWTPITTGEAEWEFRFEGVK